MKCLKLRTDSFAWYQYVHFIYMVTKPSLIQTRVIWKTMNYDIMCFTVELQLCLIVCLKCICIISDNEAGTILGLEKTWFVVVLVSMILVFLVCIVAVSICICKRYCYTCPTANSQPSNTSYSCKFNQDSC